MQVRNTGQVPEVLAVTNDSTSVMTPSDHNEVSSTHVNDLTEHIKGLYCLLDLCKDDGSNGFVDKIIISKESLKKLCNDMIPSSFKSISDINYVKLNSVSFRLIGCYGNHTLIAKLLLNKTIINQQLYDLLTASQSSDMNEPSLRPGIYLLIVNTNLGLVIHWPEVGCYEENISSQRKKNMINLHRYLTKLTDHQICFMSNEDLESFDWNLDNSTDSVEDEAQYEFGVMKSKEEREDFKIYPGFKVNLSDKIRTEINNRMENGIPLYPIVVESATNQSFVTRQLISALFRNDPSVSSSDFPNLLKRILPNYCIHFDRNTMNMNALELFVKYGLEMEDELLSPLHKALENADMQNKNKKDQEESAINNDKEIINKMALTKLHEAYTSHFEKFNAQDNFISYIDLNRIQERYPEIENQIEEKIKIKSKKWEKMKIKYNLCIIILDILKTNDKIGENNDKVGENNDNVGENNDEITKSAIETFYEMFNDNETNLSKLMEKYTQISKSRWSKFTSLLSLLSLSKDSNIEKAEQITKNKTDAEFIQGLVDHKLFEERDDIKNTIISAFFGEYQEWRKNFPSSIRTILSNVSFNKQLKNTLKQELEEEKQRIKKDEFEKICNEIENKYQNGSMRFNVLNIDQVNGFRLSHEIETPQLKITIYKTSLEEAGRFRIQEDESYVPSPILFSNYFLGQYGTSFCINPQDYDFRKISQFGNKFLLILWNKKNKRIEIFFDAAQRLSQHFKSNPNPKPFKTLNPDENFLIAVNEPKELIAIYDTKKVVLNVYSFNDGQAYLYARNPNIQLLQWYNNMVPKLQYFLFIKDTEELCFVEEGGRARIFNLINQQFRAAVCNLPRNSVNVLSSLDGSCIIAFVKEKLEGTDLIVSTDDEERCDSIRNDVKEINRAYVYFCTNFGGAASKVIDLPPSFQSLEFLQFSCINKRQTHLMSLDLQNGCFISLIAKITLEKAQYSFQKCRQKQSLGLVKFNFDLSHKDTNYTFIEGNNTHFETNVQIGENIVIMSEKYNVLEVLSDTKIKIKIAQNFKPISGFDEWMKFHIEPKAKLNGLIDAYRLMFEKFPIDSCIDPEQNHPLSLKIVLDIEDNDNDIEGYSEKFEEYISEILAELKRSTKKPATTLKKFSTSVITFQKLDIENVVFQKEHPSEYELGEWIIQLCCLIPIQIAVARDNLFQPLKDGLFWNENDQIELNDGYGHHLDSIAKNISFGWYEGIFKYFGDKKVKVVSSMGEQSCGKSFMLNHLVGTAFDGSAMRCTEGVWMSLVNTKEYVYVALDFEGIKSLERTPQEDLFLTLFNTATSNLILFKNQFAVSRDMSTMFQRFQDGAKLFESDSIFQGKLCIIIKDVPTADKEGIMREFNLKFDQLVAEEGEDNFITRLYRNELNIIPWPVFNDAAWFKMLLVIKKMLDKQETKYKNARTFLQNTKVIMAKLKICDWSPLDENLIQIHVADLKISFPIAVSNGVEQEDSYLMNHDTEEHINDSAIKISGIFEEIEESTELLADTNLLLSDETKTFIELSEKLRVYFEENIQSRKESSDDNIWFTNFDKFLKYIIGRRESRVKDWYEQNTAKFPQDNSKIVNGKHELEQIIRKLIHFWTLCGLTCHQCGLRCVKNRDHEENHDCLTDHKCHFPCHFTEAHNGFIPGICSHKAGHEGKHACNKISHLCGKPCNLNGKRNCQKVCSKEIGHDDSEHLCQSTRHYCGENCSLSTHTRKGDYNCLNECIKSYEEEHDLHRCENETCPIQCPIPDCQGRCQSNDHFHSNSNEQVDHFCGNEHQCRELCEDDGICKVVTEPKKKEEMYKGLVTETLFTFTKYIQLSERLKCNKKIPPNEFKHAGKHTHEEDGFHFCNAKCQFCEYFCILPYGHTQIHETRHGNMTQTEFTFTGEVNEFEYAGYKLRVGDQGIFVLCNMFCKDLGRHRHIDYCQNEENCKLGNQGQDIKHINEQIQPNPDKPKDFISHKLFWERTGFKDPYSAQEQQDFSKCDHECQDEKHHRYQVPTSAPPTKSFCELPLFHVSLNPSSDPPNDCGYISLDGHHFNCENPSTQKAAFHIIFVLDRSGSMVEDDKRPILNFNLSAWYKFRNHNNRIGAVYQAVYQFMDARIKSISAYQNQMPSDRISLILFDHEVIVPYENRDLTDPNDLLDKMLQHQARGGTNYGLAIQEAGSLITSHFDPNKTNIIIFLSDGECNIPTNQLHAICKQNKTRGSPLYLNTVLFSSDSHSHPLEEMTNIAKSYHSTNNSSGALRCHFTRAIDEISLIDHFVNVASSLREHKPTLLKKDLGLQHIQ